jgi:hypothetical protein
MPNPSKLDALLRGIAGQAPESKYIRAYHGSPHSFDRFDASKIGTGEGAQAYGHGLYFAGAEDVARSYRDITPALLPPEAAELQQQLKQLFRQHADLTGELHMAADTDGTFAVGWGSIKDPPKTARARIVPQLETVNQQLQDVQMRMHKILHNRRGHMYEVEIARPEGSLLDWDATLDEQQQLLPAAERAIGRIQDPGARYDAMGIIEEPAGNKGRDLYGILKAYAPESNLAGDHASFASRALLEEGIPGIRYLDGNSRAAGQGTRNFVMFPGTEDSIRIRRKYGVMAPIPMAAGAAGATMEE